MRTHLHLAALLLFASPAQRSISAQSSPPPIPVHAPCELLKDTAHFNHQTVAIRGRVRIAFEDFQFSAGDCPGNDGIWLEYGRGPRHQPTVWCCGDMIPRDSLKLVRNSDFKNFHRYLTSHSSGCSREECYFYEVTATLTGRLDHVAPRPCADGKECCFGFGFGHFGGTCTRLVIQSVSDVVATRKPSAKQ